MLVTIIMRTDIIYPGSPNSIKFKTHLHFAWIWSTEVGCYITNDLGRLVAFGKVVGQGWAKYQLSMVFSLQ